MKNFIILVLVFLVSTTAHWAFASAGAEFNLNVNFMLAAGAAVCSFYDGRAGFTFMFFGGMFLDFFGVNMFGAYALTFTLCAAAVYLVKNSLDFDSPAAQAVLVYNLAGVIFLKGTFWPGFTSVILGAAITAVIAPVVFYIVKKLSKLPSEK